MSVKKGKVLSNFKVECCRGVEAENLIKVFGEREMTLSLKLSFSRAGIDSTHKRVF